MRGLMAAALALGLMLGACGSDDNSDTDKSPTPGTQPTTAATKPAASPSTASTPAASTPAASGTPSDGNAPGIPTATGQIVTTASGLRYIDLTVGPGPAANESACVTVHYTGWTTDGTKFDSSVDRGQPATFPLSGVISGWTEGVGSMNEGGKRRLIIPGDLAYGPNGNPRAGIGPDATLIFDVELVKVGAPPNASGRCPA